MLGIGGGGGGGEGGGVGRSLIVGCALLAMNVHDDFLHYMQEVSQCSYSI